MEKKIGTGSQQFSAQAEIIARFEDWNFDVIIWQISFSQLLVKHFHSNHNNFPCTVCKLVHFFCPGWNLITFTWSRFFSLFGWAESSSPVSSNQAGIFSLAWTFLHVHVIANSFLTGLMKWPLAYNQAEINHIIRPLNSKGFSHNLWVLSLVFLPSQNQYSLMFFCI